MRLIKIKLLVFISILLISLSSCTKEIGINDKNISTTNKTNIELSRIVSNVKNWYDSSLNIKNISILEANIKSSSVTNLSTADLNIKDIQWNKAFISFDTVGKRTVSIPLSLDSVTGEYIQMVVGITDKGYTGYFIKSIPDAFYYKVQRNIYEFYNFSGSIYIYDISGKFLNYINFEQGKVQSKNLQTQDSSQFNSFSDPIDAELPTVTVVGYINNSGYLVIVPFAAGGTGGEGFAMTSSVGSGVFVGGDGSVTAPLRIANFIKRPCLSEIVNKIIDANLANNMSQKMLLIFGKSEKMNLFFFDRDNNLYKVPGNHTVTHPQEGVSNYNIYIDLTKAPSKASDEYIAYTIIHEIAHAIIKSNNLNNLTNTEQHYQMLNTYIDQMKSFLQEIYKVSDQEALSMIFAGISDLNNDIEPGSVKDDIDKKFKEIVSSYNFSIDFGDSNYYLNNYKKFSEGEKGTISCNF